MGDTFTSAKRREIMQAVRRERTAPEELLAKALRALDIRYRRNIRSLPGKPDFYIPKTKLIIFVHGCFWHGHSTCLKGNAPKTNTEYWKEKIKKNRLRDGRVVRQLRSAGYSVYIVWECEIRHEKIPPRVLKRLLM